MTRVESSSPDFNQESLGHDLCDILLLRRRLIILSALPLHFPPPPSYERQRTGSESQQQGKAMAHCFCSCLLPWSSFPHSLQCYARCSRLVSINSHPRLFLAILSSKSRAERPGSCFNASLLVYSFSCFPFPPPESRRSNPSPDSSLPRASLGGSGATG